MEEAKRWNPGVLATLVALACDGSAHRTRPVPVIAEAGPEPASVPALPVTPPMIERLAPTADCTQPSPVQRCADGYCEVAPGCFIMGAPRGFCDALRYANWLSERNGLRPCYELTSCAGEVGLDLACSGVRLTGESACACEGYRLPSEAEWEYAARAGTISAFYSGESVSTELGECVMEPALEPSGWYCKNSENHPHTVAQKQPNAYGLYDMHGNLGEWASDLHDGLGCGQGPLIDPRGTKTPGKTCCPIQPRLSSGS